MRSAPQIRRMLGWAVTLVAVLAFALPAAAQSTGMVKGKVVGPDGKPVEGAQVTIEFQEGVNRKNTTKTNKNGEFIQIGLFPGSYKVTAEKQGLGAQTFDARIRIGQTAEVNFALVPGQVTQTAEDRKKGEALKKTFDEGVALSRAGQYEQAVAKFTEGTTIVPNCFDCYYNIAYAEMQQKKFDEAEAAFKKAIEMKPDYVEAWNALATLYNAQKKFDQAAEASSKAASLAAAAPIGAGGANVDAIYNQGVILWNAGKLQEAKAQFEKAVQLNPGHAEAHYQLGMALISGGDMAGGVAQFEEYVKLAPEGPNAAQAKAAIAALKK